MEGCGLVAITDRAQENREYVHRLLKANQPEFAALLERLERELLDLGCLSRLRVVAAVGSSRQAPTHPLLAVLGDYSQRPWLTGAGGDAGSPAGGQCWPKAEPQAAG
jgi:hypothetical protein